MLRIFLLFFVICCVRALKPGDPGVRTDGVLACNATYWKYDRSKDICVPKCKFGCGEGRCIRPNECECDEPFIFRNKKCEQPKCESPYCRNPICKYKNRNSQCKCDDGYEIKGNIYNCVPKCTVCTNGECIAPNTCQCNSGYEIDVDGTCKPVCTGCNNGECVAPEKCSCNTGYKIEADGTCKPVCSRCSNGECIAPEKCSCNTGYRNDADGTCKPVCTKCSNGECVAPERCSCNTGYRNDTDGTCKPVCSRCSNGECIAPEKCSCNTGYRNDANGTCKPVCTKCSNGECVAPERCSCNTGYRNDADDTCKPVCSDCNNGECVAPERCSCNNGYKNDIDGKCKPICLSCDNGDCFAPGDCRCTNGYEKINGLCKPKCDAGYKRYDDSEECLPYCSKPCINGFCSAPNECSCDKGYKKDTLGYCSIPICTKQCVNATCVKPDECECLDGHIKTSDFVCKPKCTCDNGKCIDSGAGLNKPICMCNAGYNMVGGSCKPVCSNRCVNGVCFEPERCLCEDGFSSNETHAWICTKPCVSCNNGLCNTRGECICQPGYEIINDNCVPTVITCGDCQSNCNDTECWCVDGRRCERIEKAKIDSEPTGLAGWQTIWLGGAIGAIVLVATLVFVFIHMWKKQQQIRSKENGADKYVYGSVAYTVPGTLETAPGASVPNLYSEDTYEEEDEQANGLMPADESEHL